ncbi:MAG: DUF6178 family protein [Deltaproteobacteria bacterium]
MASLKDKSPSLPQISAREQLEAWIHSDDGGKRLRRVPPDELYAYLQEVGLADATEAVRLSSAEQFRALIDLDIWHRDRPDPSRLLTWLRAARGSGGGRYLAKLRKLDVELFELLIKERLVLHDLTQEPEPPDSARETFKTFDGYFQIELPDDPVESNALRQLVTDLYAEDPRWAQRVLTAVRWELTSELEEQAYRWRSARLADIGFPPLEEAASLYARLDVALPPPPASLPETPRALPALAAGAPDFLRRSIALLAPEEQGRVQAGLAVLANHALVADGVDPSDPTGAREILERVQATLSLGLTEQAQGDPAAAARLLVEVALKRSFQIGFTETLKLQWAAERALWTAPLRFPRANLPCLDAADREIFQASSRRRPLFPGTLDAPGAPNRPFRTPLDIATVRLAIERAQERARLLAAAGVDPAEAEPRFAALAGLYPLSELGPSDLFLCGLAREMAGAGWLVAPLSPSEATSAIAAIFPNGGPSPRDSVAERARARLDRAAASLGGGAAELARDFWALCARRLEREIGHFVASHSPLPPSGPLKVEP